mmetsp:Transcript_96824/g.166956  ORF Transcript_96824/g.166956 Transcript_96824/m.166956 type:complete len:243 (-) Transcript_96824:562-1290(-)
MGLVAGHHTARILLRHVRVAQACPQAAVDVSVLIQHRCRCTWCAGPPVLGHYCLGGACQLALHRPFLANQVLSRAGAVRQRTQRQGLCSLFLTYGLPAVGWRLNSVRLQLQAVHGSIPQANFTQSDRCHVIDRFPGHADCQVRLCVTGWGRAGLGSAGGLCTSVAALWLRGGFGALLDGGDHACVDVHDRHGKILPISLAIQSIQQPHGLRLQSTTLLVHQHAPVELPVQYAVRGVQLLGGL